MIAVLVISIAYITLLAAVCLFVSMSTHADHDAAQLEEQWDTDEQIDEFMDDELATWRDERRYPDITTD